MQHFSRSIWLFALVFLANHLELSCFPGTDTIFIDLLKERSSPNQYDMTRSPSITTETSGYLGQNHPTQDLTNQLLDKFLTEYQDYNSLVKEKGLNTQPIKVLKTAFAAWRIMGTETNLILRRYGTRFLLYRLLSLCAYLKQDRGLKVAEVKKEVQTWARNLSQDYLEGLAKIEMIHDKTFSDLLGRNDETAGVTDQMSRIRTNYVFFEVIFMAFDDYKDFFPHAGELYNFPWLYAGREIHYKINELESLHPDMCKYTAKYPSFQFTYPKQEVRTHDSSQV